MNERANRIKYIRVLEKFFKQNLSLLKLEDFSYELYSQRVNKNYEEFKKKKSVELTSNYLVELKRHIDNVLNFANKPSNSIDEQRQILLKEANTILKNKSQNNYKKDKHKNAKFDDGY